LCQIFARLPKTIVLSDPACQLHAIAEYYDGNIAKKDVRLLLKNIFCLQGKPLNQVSRWTATGCRPKKN